MNGYSEFGSGSGSVWTLGPTCDGSEENILDCNNYQNYNTYANSYIVGVICGELYSSDITSVKQDNENVSKNKSK